MLTGSAQYDSAFSRTKWTLLPGHTKLHYEAEVVVEEMASPIKKKPVTKFDKLRSHAAVAPVISDRVSVTRWLSLFICDCMCDCVYGVKNAHIVTFNTYIT